MKSPAELLVLHDDQVRGMVAERMPPEWDPVWDGPALHVTTPAFGIVYARDLGALSVDELDGLIARVRDHFAARGRAVSWKTYGNDRPDLAARLERAGFAPEPPATVVIGPAEILVQAGEAPDDVVIRATTDPVDLRAIAAMHSEIWAEDWSWIADFLESRVTTTPDDITIFLAEAGGRVVSAAWLIGMPGTEFASFMGGSTLAEWRRRGIYRALIARRAQVAVDRGVRYLMVDASDDSRPILEHLGLQAVTTTTPWTWTPPAS